MSQGSGPGEVRIRLVVDDRASDTTEKLRQSLQGGGEELEKARKHGESLFGEMFKAGMATELVKGSAELLAEGVRQAWEMTEHLVDSTEEAADASNLEVRNLAGMMTMLDHGQHSMAGIRDYAQGLQEDLEIVGVKAGVSTSQIVGMYQSVIERGAKSSEEARELTEQMTIVGKVIPGGADRLAESFNEIEMGMYRARNPLIQLIATTGLLKGNAYAVAQQMQKMTPEQQIRLATEAIAKQSEALKKAGAAGVMMPTMGELRTSFEGLREIVLKSIGEPLLAHLQPMLGRLRDFLLDHLDHILEIGDRIGRYLGGVIDSVGEAASGIYDGIVQDWETIRGLYTEAVDIWRAAWGESEDKAQSIHDTFVSISQMLVSAFEQVLKYVRAAVELYNNFKDLNEGRTWGSTNADVAGRGAMGSANAIGPQAVKAFDEAAHKAVAAAQDAGASEEDLAKINAKLASARDAMMARQGWAAQVQANVASGDTDDLSKAVNSAVAAHDEASEAWVLSTIAGSDSMTRALMTGAIQVDGGFESLKGIIDEQAPELARKIKALGQGIKGEGGIKGQGPQVNFYGAHFQMHNDFRDKDPDRIMTLFKQKVGQAAVSRQQSKVASFGGL
jgi:hypothetical protein